MAAISPNQADRMSLPLDQPSQPLNRAVLPPDRQSRYLMVRYLMSRYSPEPATRQSPLLEGPLLDGTDLDHVGPAPFGDGHAGGDDHTVPF